MKGGPETARQQGEPSVWPREEEEEEKWAHRDFPNSERLAAGLLLLCPPAAWQAGATASES